MTPTLEEMAILRLPEVKRLTGLSRSTIYKMISEGKFPRSVSLGSRAVGWRAINIRAWLQTREYESC